LESEKKNKKLTNDQKKLTTKNDFLIKKPHTPLSLPLLRAKDSKKLQLN
jgi:hypothetical protein